MIDIAPQSVTTTSRRRPRLGFAGTGWIGRHRMEALAHSGLADIAAVYEPAADAAQAAAAIAGDATFVETFDQLLSSKLDAVVIATPNHLHAEQAIAALRSGHAVFCQKPLARNGRETAAVIAAARDADRLLHVDLSYRFTTGMQRIRELVRAGKLGRIYAIEAVFHNAYGPAKSWFYDAALAGGGCLLDLGIHLVDLVLWTLDFPLIVSASGHLARRDRQTPAANCVEEYAAAQLWLAGDTTVQLACSWHAPAGCDARIGLTFYGTEGGAAFSNVNGSFYDFTAEWLRPDRTRERLAGPPDAWGGRAAIAWCERLAQSPRFDPAIDYLNRVAAALDAIYARQP
jgi:predicted dehydrogenase